MARALAQAGLAQRLIVRSLSRAPQLQGSSAVRAEYGDRSAALGALEGVKTLFMVSGKESATRREEHATFIRAAADAGVQHIVYTSFFAAAPQAVFTHARDHHQAEHLIRESGMTWTFLRNNFYMDVLPHFTGDDDVLRGPAADGRCSFVQREDIARVAATVLQDPQAHANQTYDLTGPQALTLEEVAATMSQVLGRPIRYHAESVAEAYESRRAWPAEKWEYDAWVTTYTAIASGDLAPVSNDVERVTGQRPVTFEQFLKGSQLR